MKYYWAAANKIGRMIFLIALLSGCGVQTPILSDNSKLVVYPGRGISGYCETGMTLSQIGSVMNDVSTHSMNEDWRFWNRWKTGRFVLMPSLGAITFLDKEGHISLIDFYVLPYRSSTIPGLTIERPFAGSIDGGLSFSQGVLSKSDVEKVFGKLPVAPKDQSFLTLNKPCVLNLANGIEYLWYFDKGIAFVVHSNVVTSFKVYSPGNPGLAAAYKNIRKL